MKKPLDNFEDEALLQKIIECQDPIKAVIQLYPQRSVASAKRYLLSKLSSAQIKSRLDFLLDISGLSVVDLVDKHKQLLQATVDGNQDNGTQLRAVELGYKIHRLMDSGGPITTNINIKHNQINMKDNTITKLAGIIDKLNALNSKVQGLPGEVVEGEIVK